MLYLSPSVFYPRSEIITDMTPENSNTRHSLSTLLTQQQRPSDILETATIKMDGVETVPGSLPLFSFVSRLY